MAEQTDDNNRWRLETPGHDGWRGPPEPMIRNKYFMVSARRPRAGAVGSVAHADGCKIPRSLPGVSRQRQGREIPEDRRVPSAAAAEHQIRGRGRAAQSIRQHAGGTARPICRPTASTARVSVPEQGPHHLGHPGSPNSARPCAGSSTTGRGRCSALQRSAVAHGMRCAPDHRGAIAEIERWRKARLSRSVAALQTGVGPPDHEALNYNLPEFDPLWACVRDVDLPDDVSCLHRARSANRPRQRRRGDQLRGALPGADHGAHRKPLRVRGARPVSESSLRHHRGRHRLGGLGAEPHWMRPTRNTTCGCAPKLKMLPSEYFKQNGFASFQEDKPGLDLAASTAWWTTSCGPTTIPHHEGHLATFGRGDRADHG